MSPPTLNRAMLFPPTATSLAAPGDIAESFVCGGDVNGHDSASLKKDMEITSFSGIPCPEAGKNGGKAEV